MGLKQSQFSLDFNSRLHRAISRRDEKTTRYLIEKVKVDINHIEDGHAPINLALYRRNDGIVNLLIKAGCRLHPGPECEVLPLLQAVYMCHTKYIALLLANGCGINARDKEGKSALHIAVSIQTKEPTSINIVDMLISNGAEVNTVDMSGQTALHVCCNLNKVEEAKRLMQTPGCDLNIQSAQLDTPLMEATQQGHEQLVKFLLEAGCDLEVSNSQGFTALLLAVSLKLHKILELLLDKGADKNKQADLNGMSAIHYAVQISDGHAVRCILTVGCGLSKADVNLVDRQLRTPLMLAAALGHSETVPIVEMLLSDGADLTVCNMEGRTSLHQAANYGRLETCLRLLDSGAEVSAEDRTGKTPLLKAAAEGHTPIVQMLLQRGSKVNHRDSQGRTALYLAADQGRTDTMDVLLKAGAMMDLADKEGNAPLHRAVRFPSLQPQALWRLVANGCDPINLDRFLEWILQNEILAKTILFADTGLEVWYDSQRRNPKTLRHICRVAFHQFLGIGQRHNPRVKVSQLPLPSSLVDFVSLKLL